MKLGKERKSNPVQGPVESGDRDGDSDREHTGAESIEDKMTEASVRSLRDGNQIKVFGVNVTSSRIFDAGMAILYIRFTDDEKRELFLEEEDVLDRWEIEDVREQYGDSIMFFGDIAEKTRKIRAAGLDPDMVNAGILMGRKSIMIMSAVLEKTA